jgi:hypothetical protein
VSHYAHELDPILWDDTLTGVYATNARDIMQVNRILWWLSQRWPWSILFNLGFEIGYEEGRLDEEEYQRSGNGREPWYVH